jgi:DeoR/GlpR family transcriptional regulator of sugar metabolism
LRPGPAERQSELIEVIRPEGELPVRRLRELFAVSKETLRRDLRSLERRRAVSRTYGKVRPVESGAFETALPTRAESQVDEKERIAKTAVAHLGQARVLYIDEGFTAQLVAERLPRDRALTVVTPALPTAIVLAEYENVAVFALGGRVRANTLGVVDPPASALLAHLTIDLAIMGANAISIDRGLSTPDPAVAAIKLAAIQASNRRVFVGAHTKFGFSSFVRFADVTDFELLITGVELPAARAAAFRSGGTRILRV